MLHAAGSFASFALANPAAFNVMSRLEVTKIETPGLWAAREQGFFAVIDLVATTWGLGRTQTVPGTVWVRPASARG